MNVPKMPGFVLLLLSVLLFGRVAADEARPEHAPPVRVNPDGTMVLSTLAAHYDLKLVKAHELTQTDWYLWREADSIEMANVNAGQNEIWLRVRADEYSCRRVFHKARRVVDYSPGEIRARGTEPDWSKLASVISPKLLEELKRGSSKILFGQKAVRYTGKVGGQFIDLWWLEKAGLPASLQITQTGGRMSLALKELGPLGHDAWARVRDDRIADYGFIDAADFGDMESDPFVARLMQHDGRGHTHDLPGRQ